MDVTDVRFGTQARDRDELALQVLSLFKRFLEEFTDQPPGDANNQSSMMDGVEEDMRDNVTNDSFASARSGQRQQQHHAGGDTTGGAKPPKYADDALLLLSNERNTLFIDFKDVEIYDSDLASDIANDFYRFHPYLCRAAASYAREERIRQAETLLDPDMATADRLMEREKIKKELDNPHIRNKQYYVGFYNVHNHVNIRQLSCQDIGRLRSISGQVTRAHSVHPELIIGCFKCMDCLNVQYQEQRFRYTQPAKCSNDNCNNRSRFELILEKSRFTDFQRLRIQESQKDLQRGRVPRSFDVIIRGSDQMECIQPGDECTFIGTLIAMPDVGQLMSGIIGTVQREMATDSGVTGLKSLGVREMTQSLAFLSSACIIRGHEKPCVNTDQAYRDSHHDDDLSDFTEIDLEKVNKMSKDPLILEHLSESIFPSIYGCDDVKQSIILLLLGGVGKRTDTGSKLRGDINICLVGDPSTAKSQFLKIVTDFAPVKAVYASGKASSASGLTASVARDTDGGFVIEAGALMLADRGICCIDEFDKMDLKDQVAIHEAMEQQTISITKAGITATLNSRTSILAAANPIGGTYDSNRDLRSNLGFSLPIMSRFDLFFVLIDPHDIENDRAIAGRILDMHMVYADPKEYQQSLTYSFEDIKLYLRFARKYQPKIPVEVADTITQEYVRLRNDSKASRKAWRITVRQLESLIRLSEAIARIHCDEIVRAKYVKMASRLIEKTQVKVGKSEVELDDDLMQQPHEINGNAESQGMYEGELESQPLGPSQPATQKVRISLETYKGMAMVFITKLRNLMDLESSTEMPAMKRSELIDWYLHQCLAEINTETELMRRRELCDKVLTRLIQKENVLLELRDGQILHPDSVQDDPAEDRPIMMNPNFTNDIEELFDEVI